MATQSHKSGKILKPFYDTVNIISKRPYFECCNSPEIIQCRGNYVCKNCAVVHEPIMRNPFHIKAVKSHCSKKQNHYGCRTTFSLENCNHKNKSKFWRLTKLNNCYNTAHEHSIKVAKRFFFQIASQLEIPHSFFNDALQLYKKAVEARLTVRRGIKQVMVASLYITCNLRLFSCHINDFSEASQIPVKNLRKSYNLILNQFNIKLKRFTCSHYLAKFSVELGLSGQIQSHARKILNTLMQKGINLNNNPRGYAAAAIYFVASALKKEKNSSQKNLAKRSRVSEVTLRKYVKYCRT